MAELIINLWAIYDGGTGLVYGLAGRAYNVDGDDEQKLTLLRALARTDHVTAKRYELPARLTVSFADGTERARVTTLRAVMDSKSGLFEDMFANIENELPPLTDFRGEEVASIKQKIPSDPLCVVTTLYEDENGNITPVVTDEDRAWVRQQERLRGREYT
ncbi:hypothetical protein [Spectribacter hydrogenoxidans]|uniref:Uncharacterized protein n=1 Tax=Spectribacter hydrogenoxidans TaxID=3075608 RepID=A0ABU3BXD4_9GAMM|nr:hypothetical protein [Salinisphaera sp. W335]MDT0633952.1 hypothetical protein [Salinisphaera sp. W335]